MYIDKYKYQDNFIMEHCSLQQQVASSYFPKSGNLLTLLYCSDVAETCKICYDLRNKTFSIVSFFSIIFCRYRVSASIQLD